MYNIWCTKHNWSKHAVFIGVMLNTVFALSVMVKLCSIMFEGQTEGDLCLITGVNHGSFSVVVKVLESSCSLTLRRRN